MAPSWPLVGRQVELDRIARAMARKDAAGLVVTGPAGVGKTRLVTEALAAAPAAQFSVHRATATHAAAAVPLGALAHLLPDERRVPERTDLLRRTARDLVARAAPRRAVVAVDDSHLLDDASAALVHHLATASTVFVLATVRDGKASPDAVRLLTKDHVAEQLALDPLSAEHIGEALRQALGGQLSGAVAHHLTTLSEGNPLLVTELVEAALDEGRLVERSGLWQLTGEWVNPTTLPELVRDRLSRLAPEVRAAAELLALGEPLGAAELEVLLAPDVIGAAEREGLFVAVVTRRRQQVRLVHPLYGEALRAAIPPMRARAAHRALADALAATGARRRGDVLRLAVWRLEGGRTGDPDLLLRAAREEGALFDGGMAERLALAAEEAGGGLAARLARVDALRWSGRAVEADRLLVDADAMCGDVAQQCQVGALRASNLYFGLNRPADAERVLDETRRRVCSPAACRCPDGEEALCAKLDALKAEFLLNAGRVGEARTHTRALLARPDLGIRTYASAASIASVAQTWSGRSGQGGAVAAQALARCGEAGGELHFASTELLHFSRCLAQLYAGQHALAGQLAAGRYQRALERHAEVLQGQWALALGELALFSGRVATARRWLREAAALIEQHSPSMGRYGVGYALTFTAEAAALAGDLPGVDAALSRAAALLPDSARLCNRERGRVWAAATRGELTTARSLALAGADALAAVGAHLHEAMACHDVARLGAPQSVTARLNALAPTFEGRLGTLYARHAEALAARDGPALEAVAADFATLGATLLAAEAAAEAADAHRRAGRKTSALAASRRSRELAGRCEGARTPALALAGDPLPLTPREQEIATLAAHGLTDRDIAQRLVVSRRTVHNHLHRTYTKLGIAGRRQLRSVLG